MTKADIADRIREKCSFDKKDIIYIIDEFVDEVKQIIEDGNTVEIRGFGTFYRAEKKARTVKSHMTPNPVEVPARYELSFRSSRKTDKNMGA